MTFLPIVRRELRVAARRRSSFRLRWWTSVLAIVFALLWLLALQLSSSHGSAGASLFAVIHWYALAFCLLSGVFLTADSLSAEKREGTLGLLFLSDLKGYDVVLGKFVASALNAFYALLALLPAAALSLLLGGVTNAQFWRTALALGNVLFYSLAAGMFISALARDSHTSMANTTILLLLLVGALPLLASIFARLFPSPFWQGLQVLSPWYPIHLAAMSYPVRGPGFWGALLSSGVVACGLLAGASLLLPRSWNDTVIKLAPARSPLVTERTSSHHRLRRSDSRAELLTRNPVQWLTSEQLKIQWLAWLVVAAWALTVLISLALGAGSNGSLTLSAYLVLPFGFLLKLIVAVQASRFFAEGRRNGTLVLLLCSPLTNQEIVRGHLRALGAAFFWPLTVFIGFLFAPASVSLTRGLAAGSLDTAFSAFSGSFLAFLFVVRFALDLLAVCWFGMALALTSRRPNLVSAMTVLFVLILPSIFSFCWLDILADIFFISWGIAKLQAGVRTLITCDHQSPLPFGGPAPMVGGAVPPKIGR